jgi:hypothetical protein
MYFVRPTRTSGCSLTYVRARVGRATAAELAAGHPVIVERFQDGSAHRTDLLYGQVAGRVTANRSFSPREFGDIMGPIGRISRISPIPPLAAGGRHARFL